MKKIEKKKGGKRERKEKVKEVNKGMKEGS